MKQKFKQIMVKTVLLSRNLKEPHNFGGAGAIMLAAPESILI
jgi:hypothetical protein